MKRSNTSPQKESTNRNKPWLIASAASENELTHVAPKLPQ